MTSNEPQHSALTVVASAVHQPFHEGVPERKVCHRDINKE